MLFMPCVFVDAGPEKAIVMYFFVVDKHYLHVYAWLFKRKWYYNIYFPDAQDPPNYNVTVKLQEYDLICIPVNSSIRCQRTIFVSFSRSVDYAK
jgi:hypothetical protein